MASPGASAGTIPMTSLHLVPESHCQMGVLVLEVQEPRGTTSPTAGVGSPSLGQPQCQAEVPGSVQHTCCCYRSPTHSQPLAGPRIPVLV